MDKDKLEWEGNRAQSLLDSPDFQAWVEDWRKSAFQLWINADPKDKETLDNLHAEGRAVNRLLNGLNSKALQGKAVIQAAINKEKAEEAKKKRRERRL